MPVAFLRMIYGLSADHRWLRVLSCLLVATGAAGVASQPLAAIPMVTGRGIDGSASAQRHRGPPDWGMAAGVARQRNAASRIAGNRGGVDYRLDYLAGAVSEADASLSGLPADGQASGAPGLGSVNARLGWQLNAGQRFELTGALARNREVEAPWIGDAALQRKRSVEAAWAADWSSRYSTRMAAHGSQQQDGLQLGSRPDGEQQRGYVFENRWKQGRHTWTAGVTGDSSSLLQGGPGRSQEQEVFSLEHVYERNAQSLALELAYLRDDEFGAYRSGGLSWDYTIVPQWRVSAVAGSSLEIPTLYQRTSRPGAAAKRPGANRRVELHLDWADDARAWGLALYRRDHRDLPSLAPADLCQGLAGCGAAANPTQLQGVTVSGKNALGRVMLGGSVDLQQAVDAGSGLMLPRHARHVLKLDGSTRLGRWQIGPQWQLVGRRFADASHHNQLAGYGRLDVQASARFAPAWELVFKVDNAADRKYRLTSSQVAAGRAWSVQLHWVPK